MNFQIFIVIILTFLAGYHSFLLTSPRKFLSLPIKMKRSTQNVAFGVNPINLSKAKLVLPVEASTTNNVNHTLVPMKSNFSTGIELNVHSYSIDDFGKSAENTVLKYLTSETKLDENEQQKSHQFSSRQVYKAHFSLVSPEPVSSPRLVISSPTCSVAIGLDVKEINRNLTRFTEIFSGKYIRRTPVFHNITLRSLHLINLLA